jgi:hypothetical protein
MLDATRHVATVFLIATLLTEAAAAQSIAPPTRAPISTAAAAIASTAALGRSAQSPRVMTRRDLKRVLIGAGAAGSLCYWLNHELEGDMESAVRVVTLCGLTGAAIAATFR